MRLSRLLGGVAFAAVTVAAVWSYAANRTPHDPDQIAMLTDRLFEFGAVDFVHGKYSGPDAALFDCVAAGMVLTTDQSAQYRRLYQGVLLDNQGLFARLDANIALRRDEGMTRDNNAGGKGIAGLHDHHDASAANNARNIADQLAALPDAGPINRAIMANDIYKDLTDLMVHMAPAVHSVGLLSHDDGMPRDLDPDFATYYGAMKTAQGAAINSDPYWQAIDTALAAYARLILDVQGKVRASNGAVLHAVSGKWLALQTVAPRLSKDSPSAQVRQKAQAPCPT